MNNFLTECSYAKVNLGLKIINQSPDKYHNICSIFIQINLHDKLYFIPNKKFKIESQGIKSPIGEKNIVFKVAQILNKEFGINIKHKIIIDKNIPIGGGLGGGSSNAATTLKVLANLYDLNISYDDYIKLANQLGSDIPFFFRGGVKLIEGTGNIIKKINAPALENKKILLVFPKFNISTKWAYSQIKKHLDTTNNKTKFSPLTENVNWGVFNNDFEKIVCLTYPEILKIKDILDKEGAFYSGLSGSGSTMFGIYNNTYSLDNAISLLSEYDTKITFPKLQ